jgi:hypothetical protein
MSFQTRLVAFNLALETPNHLLGQMQASLAGGIPALASGISKNTSSLVSELKHVNLIGGVYLTSCILQNISESSVVNLGHVQHTLLNCLSFLGFAELPARSLFCVSLFVDAVHVDVQHDDHGELDAVSHEHSNICAVISSYNLLA